LIDLHTHTNESDGTLTPIELIEAAVRARLEAIAITDHDTFAGHDQAVDAARAAGLELVCGIELNTRLAIGEGAHKTVHLLAYFLNAPPTEEFRAWLDELAAGRRERNLRLAERLKGRGIDIELAEVQRLGRTLTGRPHFARVLVSKGYAATTEQAFRDYLGETAPSFVERDAPDLAAGVEKVARAGGVAVVAHPIRLGARGDQEDRLIARLRETGVAGLEAYHSDHSPQDMERYAALASKYGLKMTGGSDFHGAVKPQISLGVGRSNLDVSYNILKALRN
jgi:predicted metal-dependent phosphoesterase TrpH